MSVKQYTYNTYFFIRFFNECKNQNIKVNNKEKRKKYDKTVSLAKTKLNTMDVWISKALYNFYVSYNEVVLVNNGLREYNNMTEGIKNSDNILI